MEIDATVPAAQLGVPKGRGQMVSVMLAQGVRTNIEAGRSRLVLALDAQGRRALKRRRRLTVTVTVTVTTSTGEHRTASGTLALASR
jgi:hypothetical protein